MVKPGHHLADFEVRVSENLLNGLQKQFSITTAEELIAANANSGQRLREALVADEKDWNNLLNLAGQAIGPEQCKRLLTGSHSKPSGAKLKTLTPEQLSKYAGGLTTE